MPQINAYFQASSEPEVATWCSFGKFVVGRSFLEAIIQREHVCLTSPFPHFPFLECVSNVRSQRYHIWWKKQAKGNFKRIVEMPAQTPSTYSTSLHLYLYTYIRFLFMWENTHYYLFLLFLFWLCQKVFCYLWAKAFLRALSVINSIIIIINPGIVSFNLCKNPGR